ncbi:MAG: hypothetical protein R6V41_10600 [Desulfobacteraceae bacterium]
MHQLQIITGKIVVDFHTRLHRPAAATEYWSRDGEGSEIAAGRGKKDIS